MSKLLRYTQKLFGSTAASGRISKFGSLAAGSPVTYSGATVTPDDVQALSNYLGGWDSAVFGNGNPPLADMNALQWLFSRQLAYLMQEGIAEYDASTTYYIGSLVNYSGVICKSITDSNVGNTPSITAATANWTPAFLTRPNLPSVGQQISTTSTSQNVAASTTGALITNLTVTVTTTGRPVLLFFQPTSAALAGSISLNSTASTGNTCAIHLFRGATEIAQWSLNNGFTGLENYNVNFQFLDVVAAGGPYVYTVKGDTSANGSMSFNNLKLVAFEL